jgi:CheY-like chemotaxis protein
MPPRTVLVVDDHTPTRDAYVEYLADCGYRVVGAAHGGEAMLQAHLHRPDVVLLDIAMPVLNGVEIAAALRAYPPTASMRVVAVTGSGSWTDRERMWELCDTLLEKPCDPCVIAVQIDALAEVAA